MFPDLFRDDVFRIETRRLWLRWPRAADAEAIVRLAGDKAVAEMTARIPHPIDRPGLDRFLLQSRQANNNEGASLIMAVALLPDPARLVGVVGLETHEGAEALHLGYWLGRPHWGKGLATEAVSAMVDAYFAYASGKVLVADAMTANLASRRVLEKCGFLCTGRRMRSFPVRGGDREVDDFRLERADWLTGARTRYDQTLQ